LQLLQVTPRCRRQVFPRSPHFITALTVLAKVQIFIASCLLYAICAEGWGITSPPACPLTHRNVSATPLPLGVHRQWAGRQTPNGEVTSARAGWLDLILFVAARCKETSQPGWNHADSALSVFRGHFQPRRAPLQSAIGKHNLPAPLSWMPSVTSRPRTIYPLGATLPMAPFAGCMPSNTSLPLCPSVIRLAPIPDPCQQPYRPPRYRRGNHRLSSIHTIANDRPCTIRLQ
jgi:hypothetical protein